MQPRRANRAATLALAITAALTLGFAPAVDTGPQSEPEPSSSGKCLEGYAYITILGDNHGITQAWCIHPTDCTSATGSGPSNDGIEDDVRFYRYVQLPRPGSVGEATCYL